MPQLTAALSVSPAPHGMPLSLLTLAALIVVVIVSVLLRAARRARRAAVTTAEQLRQRERDLRAIADTVPSGIYQSSAHGVVRYANRRLEELSGKTLAEMGARPFDIVAEDLVAVAEAWRTATRSRSTFRQRFRAHRAGGGQRWVDVEAVPQLDADGELSGWIGSVWDVTEQVESTSELRRLSQIIEATPDLIAITDLSGRLTYANVAARRRLGLTPDSPLPVVSVADVYAPHELDRLLRQALPAAERDGVWMGEMDLAMPDGSIVPVSQVLVAHTHADGNVEYYSTITRDLTERRMFEARLEEAVWYDAITGLPNRAHFVGAVAAALERSMTSHRPVAVLRLNVDHFTLINNSLGHEAGNALLRRIGQRLCDVVDDCFVARAGSDEFCVLLRDVVSPEAAEQFAQRVSSELSEPMEVDGEDLFLTVSIGVAFSRVGDPPVAAESLLRDADLALHRAKDNGRARVELFAEDLREHVVKRLRTATDLHRALTSGEFRVVYQPEVDLNTGRVVAVEALLRWHHPERGLVPPGEFVPLAEQTGLIVSIGNWVLETAVQQAAEWASMVSGSKPPQVWVNLSARQLGDPTLVDQVAAVLDRFAVDARLIGLEITESALLEDTDVAVQALAGLRALGVGLAVDDFGTGYSSLSYLKSLPVDTVKIDRSFVGGLGRDNDDSAIVAAIVGMARALRLSTTAEGVENVGELEALRRLGCDIAQGHFFATAQPPAIVSRLLTSDEGPGIFADDTRSAGGIRSSDLPRPREEKRAGSIN